MKTPVYETSTGALMVLLQTRQAIWATLIKIDLINGAGSLYYSSSEWPILFNSHTYLTPAQLGVTIDRKSSKAKIKWKTGTQTNTLNFDAIPNGGLVNGQAFLSACRQGVFDGAAVTLFRAFWAGGGGFQNPIKPVGVVQMFAGHVSQVQSGRSVATFQVNDNLDLLNIQLPRVIYQGGCVNTLYDTACTLSANNFNEAGATVTGSSANLINATLTGATGIYDQGKITYTSGANNGISRSIKQYVKGTPGTIALLSPFPNIPAPGDAFNIFQGCNKLQSTCVTKFNNLVNFRGFPYIPENNTAV